MNDTLMIPIGADLSAYNRTLESAEQTFKTTLNTIKSFSTTNKIDIGINLAQFIEGKEKIKKEYNALKNEIMNNALELTPTVDNDDIEKYADDFIKETNRMEQATKDSIKQIDGLRVKQAVDTQNQIEKEHDKELAELKKHIQEKYALEDADALKRKNEEVARHSLAIQKKYAKKEHDELVKQAIRAENSVGKKIGASRRAELKKFTSEELQAHIAKTNKLNRISIQSKHETYRRILKIKHLTDKKEIVAEYRKLRKMNHEQLREYEATESKKTAIYKKQAARRNIDSAVGRGFFDSVKVVAKYGAISQALYAIQGGFQAVIAESLRFNQSIYTLQAVLNKNKTESTQLAEAVVKIGKTYGGTFADIEKGMLTLGRAGVDGTEELTKATKVLAQLALITGDTMEEGAAAMSTLLNVYPQLREEVDLLGNKMGYVANETRLGIADFSTISNYALTTAKSLNFTTDAYLALNGAMSKIGLNASTIGTNIRRIKNITDDDSQAMQEFFRVLGISQKEFADNMRKDSEKELVRFSRALNKLSEDSDRYSRATKALNIQVKGTIDNFAQIGKQNYMAEMLDGIKDETYDLERQTKTATVGMVKAWETVRNTIISLFDGKANELFDEYFNRDNVDAFNESVNDMVKKFEEWYDTIVLIVEIGFYAMLVKWAAGFLSVTTGITAMSAATLLLNSRLLLLAKNPAFLALLGVGAVATGLVMGAKTAYDYAQKLQNPDPLSDEEQLAMEQAFAGQSTAIRELTALQADYEQQIEDTETAIRMMTDAGTLNAQTDELMTNRLETLKENLNSVTGAFQDFEEQGQLITEEILGTAFDPTNYLVQYEKMSEYGSEMVADTDKIRSLQRQLQVEIEKANGTYDKRKWILKDIARYTEDIAVAEALIADEGASEKNVLSLLRLQIKLEKTRQQLRKDEAGGGRGSKERAQISSLIEEAKLKGVLAEIDALAENRLLTANEQKQIALDISQAEIIAYGEAYVAAEKLATSEKGRAALKRAELKLYEAVRKNLKLATQESKKFGKEMKKVGDNFADSLLDGDIKKAFRGLFKDIGKVFVQPLKDSFNTLFGKEMEDLVGGFYDSMTAYIEAFATKGIEGVMALANANATAGVANQASSGDPYSAWARMAAMAATMAAMGLVTSFSGGSGISEAQREAAAGKVEFDDESIDNLTDAFADAQYPLLKVTNTMSKYLRSMNSNFDAIAKSLTGTSIGGTSLTGAGYIPQYDEAFYGIWGTTTSELLGTGIQFLTTSIQELIAADVTAIRGFITEAVTETSWLGFVSDTDIKYTFTELEKKVLDSFGEAFQAGYESILFASASLGLDADAIKSKLDTASFAIGDELGKVNLDGLSDEEVGERLASAIGGAFSTVLDTVEEVSGLIERYSVIGEDALGTLGRIAYEFDQASFSFDLIGKEFIDSMVTVTDGLGNVTNDLYTVQEQVLDIVQASGGIDVFNDSMSSFMNNFYSDAEKLEMQNKSLQTSFDNLGVTMPETNEQFRALIENMEITNKQDAEVFASILALGDEFYEMTTATAELTASLEDGQKAIQAIADAWTGNLSYLTLAQKAQFAEGYLKIAEESEGTISTVDAARLAAETALRSVSTKEEYIPIFQDYIDALEDEAEEANLDDVVNKLDILIDATRNTERTIRKLA